MFTRKRWPDAIEDLLHDPEDGPLVRSLTPPGSYETLVPRMIAFLFLYEDLCSKRAEEWTWSFAEFLAEDIDAGAKDLWDALSASADKFDFWERH